MTRPKNEWPDDVHGREAPSDAGVLLGSRFGDEFIYPRWNIDEYIRQQRIETPGVKTGVSP
jgi:hypothetical protein